MKLTLTLLAFLASTPVFAGAYEEGIARFQDLKARYATAAAPVDQAIEARAKPLREAIEQKTGEKLSCQNYDCAEILQKQIDALDTQLRSLLRDGELQLMQLEDPFDREGRALLLETARQLALARFSAIPGFQFLAQPAPAPCEAAVGRDGHSFGPAANMGCVELNWEYRIGARFYRQSIVFGTRLLYASAKDGAFQAGAQPNRLHDLGCAFESREKMEEYLPSNLLTQPQALTQTSPAGFYNLGGSSYAFAASRSFQAN